MLIKHILMFMTILMILQIFIIVYEVGCMVEVTDINDLNEDIEIAQGADDLVTTFEHLRSGSYTHYWAFDRALKTMGVADGCCILGDDFCKTAAEYPSTQGNHGSRK
jgi:hypothetical protein